MGKTLIRISVSDFLSFAEEREEHLNDHEIEKIKVVIQAVQTSEAWRRRKDDQKLSKKMQEARDLLGNEFPDLSRRMHLTQLVLDLLEQLKN